MEKEVKKVEDFRDEWVKSEIIKNELLKGSFDEKKYVGRLISWGNTAFEITEVIDHGFVLLKLSCFVVSGIPPEERGSAADTDCSIHMQKRRSRTTWHSS